MMLVNVFIYMVEECNNVHSNAISLTKINYCTKHL